MDCPVCTANAEQIVTAIDGMGIICPTCGEYDLSSSVLAAEDWQRLDPDERCDVLNDAKRSGQPGVRPTITNDLLAAYMEPAEEPAALPSSRSVWLGLARQISRVMISLTFIRFSFLRDASSYATARWRGQFRSSPP